MRLYSYFCNFCLIVLACVTVYGETHPLTGRIQGKLIDADTRQPLIGANIVVLQTVRGASSNYKGEFLIEDVPVGSYSLEFSYVGYETYVKTDIIVRSQRITTIEAELRLLPVITEEVIVSAGYFQQKDEQPLSIATFSREEIRRAPGSAGDVSRIILGLPSLAKMDDQSNNLIVRGGSPLENTFYIDNMEVPNINHFPTQGASGGAISLINVDFIEDVHFISGGFPASYGDKLSSIMDISFREGNRQEFDGQLDLNFSGFGGIAEGPLFSQRGSWMISARRSYLDVLVKTVNVGSTMAPSFGDYQGKVVYDLNASHRLTFIGIAGDEHNNPDQQTAIENDMVYYGNQDNYQYMAGLNWRALWNKSGFSNISLVYSSQKFREEFHETGSTDLRTTNRSLEQRIALRNVNHFKLSDRHSLETGFEIKILKSNYQNYYAEYRDAFGNLVPALRMTESPGEQQAGSFFSYIFRPVLPLTVTLGIRGDYFSYHENVTVSPRLAFSWKFNPRITLNGAGGIYYQNLPLILLSSYKGENPLKDLRAVHYILGIEYLLTADTRLTVEVYQKIYQDFPIDMSQPALFLLDELYYSPGYSFNRDRVVSLGKASARGMEIMIQKKLAKDVYGLASASYSGTVYRGGDNRWRNRIFDNRLMVSLEGGYKPNNRWEFSLRWTYAGGRPYTPFDQNASRDANQGILEGQRINGERYPAYHSLNIRFDRRFNFSRSSLIFYLSVWNAYNRQNISSFYWNQIENKQGSISQFGLLPIFGLEYEF